MLLQDVNSFPGLKNIIQIFIFYSVIVSNCDIQMFRNKIIQELSSALPAKRGVLF